MRAVEASSAREHVRRPRTITPGAPYYRSDFFAHERPLKCHRSQETLTRFTITVYPHVPDSGTDGRCSLFSTTSQDRNRPAQHLRPEGTDRHVWNAEVGRRPLFRGNRRKKGGKKKDKKPFIVVREIK